MSYIYKFRFSAAVSVIQTDPSYIKQEPSFTAWSKILWCFPYHVNDAKEKLMMNGRFARLECSDY